MASRRLAISSLLCADDSDVPTAGPSSHSPPTSPQRHPYFATTTPQSSGSPSASGLISTPNSSGGAPVSLQYALPSRQQASSPSIQRGPTPPPTHRRSFKEVVFDNYQAPPPSVTGLPASGRALDVPDHRRPRPAQTDAYHALSHATSDKPRYEHLQQSPYPPPDPLFSTQLRPTSSQDIVVLSPPAYPVQTKQIISSAPHSPVFPYPSARRHLQQPRAPSPPSTSAYEHRSPSQQYRPTLSPIQTFHDFPLPLHHGFPPTKSSPNLVPSQHTPQRSPSRSKHSLSSLLTESPPPRSSAASLPHILNSPEMSIHSRSDSLEKPPSAGPGSGMEGLEALVQAATQERRRLDGHAPHAEGSRSSVHHVQDARSSPMLSRAEEVRQSPMTYHSPHQQVARSLPSPRQISESFFQPLISPGASSTPLHEATRHSPLIRTCSLQSSPRTGGDQVLIESQIIDRSRSPREPEHTQSSFALPSIPAPAPLPHFDIRNLSPPVQRSPPISKLSLVGPGQQGLPLQFDEIRKEPTGGAVTDVLSPVTQAIPEPPAPTKDAVAVSAKKSSKKRKADTKEGAKLKEKAAKTTAHAEVHSPSSSAHPARPAKSRPDDDAHEWLLEHYGSTSAVPLAVERPPSPRRKASRPKGSSVATDSRHVKQVRKEKSKERSPTPLEMLVDELDSKPSKSDPPHAGSSRASKHTPSDLDSELEFVVGSSTKQQSQPMDLDVDDELMRLLDEDDKPRDKPHDKPHERPHGKPHVAHSSKKSATASEHRASSRHSAVATIVEDTMSVSGAPSTKHSPMPPPASPSVGQVGDSDAALAEDSTKLSANTKAKEGGTKKKAPPKAKAKSSASKAKPKPTVPREGSNTPAPSPSIPTGTPNDDASPSIPPPKGKKSGNQLTAKRAVSTLGGGTSRSRSTSVMPGAEAEAKAEGKKGGRPQEEDKGTHADEVDPDDRLYCVCRTSYDEDRVMIACDRCDEWYHTQCVNMPDLEVDLVDQFICPICIANNPHLSLRTTYKSRCFAGLKHPRPQSPSACHKPARGAFSKYCSDECGVRYMKQRLDKWSGDPQGLWEGVKGVTRREGVVYRCIYDEPQCNSQVKEEPPSATAVLPVISPSQRVEVVRPRMTKADRERIRLQAQLDKISAKRDELKEDENIVGWREQIWDLAARRADERGDCGFDMRMCWDDDEVREYGEEVLASYEEELREDGEGEGMAVDGAVDSRDEWWCKGKKKCERHAGWQKLRQAELELEREFVETELDRLTARERDIRKRVEEISDSSHHTLPGTSPHFRTSNGSGPLQPLNGTAEDLVGVNPLENGVGLGLSFAVNGVEDGLKKGKKRKVEER